MVVYVATKSELPQQELEGRPLVEVWVFQLEDNKNMRADSNHRVGNDDDQLGSEIAHGAAGGGGRVCRHRGEEDQPRMDQEGHRSGKEEPR